MLARLLKTCAAPIALAVGAATLPVAVAQNNYTPAGTSVDNSFTLDYQVNSQDQTQITGDFDAFTVDRLVDLQVTYITDAGDSGVLPGSTPDLLFRLDNDGNDTFAYSLVATNETGEAGQEFDISSVSVAYYLDDGDGSYEPGADDTGPTSYASYTSDLLSDSSYWVVVSGTVPAGVADTAVADVVLVATAVEPTAWAIETDVSTTAGTALTADSDGNDATDDSDADIVFADGAGDDDSANDAKHSDTGQFIASSADLSVVKSVTVMATNLDGSYACNDFNAAAVSGTEYSTPGACLEYEIEVTNGGGALAAISTISDELPSGVTFIAADDDGFTGALPAFSGLPSTNTVCNGTDNCTITYTAADLAASDVGTIKIRVLVN